ncbi:unnamed protein product [Parnassius apollo]|uniref:(apollo) hypothetical protein n=1 Tax=Parnassius apollo TaxID=110799 RepID=A0A8S3W2J1_PARAO|nr:unnamed protein product [Parnassius apollo]
MERRKRGDGETDEKGIIDWNKIREVKVKNYVPEQKGLGALQTMAATELDGEMDEQDDIQSEQAVSRDLEITMRAREDEYIKNAIACIAVLRLAAATAIIQPIDSHNGILVLTEAKAQYQLDTYHLAVVYNTTKLREIYLEICSNYYTIKLKQNTSADNDAITKRIDYRIDTVERIPLSSQSSSASGDAPPATRRRSQKSLTFASLSAEESERDEKGIIDWNKIREVKVKNYVPEQKGLGALQTMAATELDGEMDEQDDIQSEQAVSRDLEITMRAREDEYIKMDGINKWTKKMYEAECTGGRNTILGNEGSTSEAKQPRLVDEADKTDNNIRERDGNGIEVQ